MADRTRRKRKEPSWHKDMVQLTSTESSSNEQEPLRKTSSLSDGIQRIKDSLINGQPNASSSVNCSRSELLDISVNVQSPFTSTHHLLGIPSIQPSILAHQSDNIQRIQSPFTPISHSPNINNTQSSPFTHPSTNIQSMQSPLTPSHHSPGIPSMEPSTVVHQSDNIQHVQSSLTPYSSRTRLQHSSTQTKLCRATAELNSVELIRSEFE